MLVSGGPAFVRDKDGDAYHWVGLVAGNVNASDKKSIVTCVVYRSGYAAALRRAIDARIK